MAFKDDGRFATTRDGVRIYFEEEGEAGKPPILIVPGLGGLEETYNHVAERMKDRYRIIKIDGRGLGLSDKPEGMYSIDMLTLDVLAVLDLLGIDKINILGHSLGGFVAQQFYNNTPERVSSIILVSTNCGYGDPHAILPPKERIDRFNEVLNPEAPDFAEKALAKTLMCYDQSFAFTPEGQKTIAEIALMSKERVVYESLVKRGDGGWKYRNFENLPKIAVPVLVIHGINDQLVPIANSDIFVSNIKDCTKLVFENCGHHPFIEKLDDFVQALSEFIHGIPQEQPAQTSTPSNKSRPSI